MKSHLLIFQNIYLVPLFVAIPVLCVTINFVDLSYILSLLILIPLSLYIYINIYIYIYIYIKIYNTAAGREIDCNPVKTTKSPVMNSDKCDGAVRVGLKCVKNIKSIINDSTADESLIVKLLYSLDNLSNPQQHYNNIIRSC